MQDIPKIKKMNKVVLIDHFIRFFFYRIVKTIFLLLRGYALHRLAKLLHSVVTNIQLE